MLVRGVGDVGSAVAHRLFVAGFGVALHDVPHPTTTRRGMAFADAAFDGHAELDGVGAILVRDLAAIPAHVAKEPTIPLAVAAFADVLTAVCPGVVVDARMRKRATPEPQRRLAPLTIGLGPGFVAGETTDLAVETGWGDDLDRVIGHGPARALGGEPRPIAGRARDRYVYAPAAGTFATAHRIGAAVRAAEAVACVGDVVLHAPFAGVLRGLTRCGVEVGVGTKVIEVDPRGADAVVTGIGERPARIAAGVLWAVERWAILRAKRDVETEDASAATT